jgi:hypothetical protein
MADYYIRTPDHDESRGPFDIAKLLTLAEANQINKNTLFYDEGKAEWIPIALNEELNAAVFPQRNKLSLKMRAADDLMRDNEEVLDTEDPNGTGKKITIEALLSAAEGNTDERLELKKRQQSFEKAGALATPTIGLMMMASALTLIVPNLEAIEKIIDKASYATIVNYPILLMGLFDVILGLLLFLAVTETYPIVRARAMITAGFGLYVGWAVGDPLVMGLCAAGGFGIFIASISQRYLVTLAAMILGIGGNGYLAYLSFGGRFTEFFAGLKFDFITG